MNIRFASLSIFMLFFAVQSLYAQVPETLCKIYKPGILDCRGYKSSIAVSFPNGKDGSNVVVESSKNKKKDTYKNIHTIIGTHKDDRFDIGQGDVKFILTGGTDKYVLNMALTETVRWKVYLLPGTDFFVGDHVLEAPGYEPKKATGKEIKGGFQIEPIPNIGPSGPTLIIEDEKFFDPYKPEIEPYLPAGCSLERACMKRAKRITDSVADSTSAER